VAEQHWENISQGFITLLDIEPETGRISIA
jgi:hypothetical protein